VGTTGETGFSGLVERIDSVSGLAWHRICISLMAGNSRQINDETEDGANMDKRDQGPFSGKGPKGYKLPPGSLEALVCDALEADGYVDASKIGVEVNSSGEASLSGTVPSREQQQLAEDCAASVEGIRSVQNRLTIDSDASDTDQDGRGEFGKNASTAKRPARTIGAIPETSKDRRR
jgi:BON domain